MHPRRENNSAWAEEIADSVESALEIVSDPGSQVKLQLGGIRAK
jgi:hypothetical protein